jgi:hypothetical protein
MAVKLQYDDFLVSQCKKIDRSICSRHALRNCEFYPDWAKAVTLLKNLLQDLNDVDSPGNRTDKIRKFICIDYQLKRFAFSFSFQKF